MSSDYGRQTPTFQVTGDYHHSHGAKAVELFQQFGVEFIPAQKLELEIFLAKTRTGAPAATSISVSRPRQNGKSYAAKFYTIWSAFIEHKSILFSAHNGPTTRKMFRDITRFILDNQVFRAKLAENGIYKSQGYEHIQLASGVIIEFSTRTNSGARGGTHDVIVIDEAQELTQEHQEAILPTMIAGAAANPQIIMLGTPPGVKTPGTVFREMHDRAHAGQLQEAWWLEWAATEIGDPNDQARWRECNPMYGYRITARALQNAADTMSAQGFAREHLGWWDAAGVAAVDTLIKPPAWEKITTKNPPPPDATPSVAVKFSPDGSRVSLAICLNPTEGAAFLEVIAARSTNRGTKWITEWILENRAKLAQIVIDGTRGERVLQQLADARLPKTMVKRVKPGDMARAVSMFLEAIDSQELRVFDQPDLTASALNCTKRRVGSQGFAWESTDTGDATLIESIALAYWASQTTRRKPGSKMLINF